MRSARRRGEGFQALEELLPRVMPDFADFAKLERAASEWGKVVGPALGGRSAPTDLVNGELLVTADTPLVASRLSMMGGNIARALRENWALEVRKVKVVVGRPPVKRASGAGGRLRPPEVTVRDEEVREFRRLCQDRAPDLPEDAADALARLQAFFTKRFRK
ncbi:MAG: DUF721 domain-containing protein, partial [Synergistaceae bacterium]|nr:DUF721 domain-containing protein [Synergistaceae bacterium]